MHLPNTKDNKDKNNSFNFIVKSPFTSYFLKKAIGLQSSYKNIGHKVASTMTPKHIYEITKITCTCPWR
jgi:large subunit ribosomal protein L11